MFDAFQTSFERIVSNIGIIGYKEEDIIKRGIKTNRILPLSCLYIYPKGKNRWLSPLIFQMMFPDNNHKIPCPKFFNLILTDQKGSNSFLYCLKFSEKYDLLYDKDKIKEIDIPIVIFIKSEKEDLESFKQFLNLINFIIVNDDLEKKGNFSFIKINDYKKVQLFNLFYFIFSLPHTSPHSLIKLKVDKEIKNCPTESIDFYFSSNCEIPCNKNDSDINILFLLLDQSIIIKILFSILTEKQIIFRASQAYLLHIIIPSILKLIFPFKWIHKCITVLPKENINFLDAPGSYIFGVLSDLISLKDLINNYPGNIIVDCDINEIYGDNILEPFNPPKNENKNKKEKENNGIIINMGKNLTQGNNVFNINGSNLYQYDKELNSKKNKFIFDNNKNNIIIDTKKSQLLVDKTNIFIDNNELKWLRKNIQLVRNPEIFYLDNLNKKNKISNNNVYLNEEDEENVILPDRPFSYNIQNIFMKYILNKLSFTESDFMSEFKNTNLFSYYNEENKYQNNSGKKIVENILELKEQQRNLDNSFNIEYILPNLNAKLFLNKIQEKLKDNDFENFEEYEKIKFILNNYLKISSEKEENNNNEFNLEIKRKNSNKFNGRKSDIKKLGRVAKLYKGRHERNKTSVLQETFSGNNNFLLFGINKSVKCVFKFYKEKGFLDFIHSFEKIMNIENIDITEEIFNKKIYQQIINILLNNQIIAINNNSNIDINKTNENIKNDNNKYNINKIYNKKNNLKEKEKNNRAPKDIIIENSPEEEENDLFDKRENIIQNNNEKEFDLANNIINNINEYNENIIPEEKENIINFPNLNNIKGIEDNCKEIDDKINHKMQYYLFIATIIEDIIKNKNKSKELIDIINKQKDKKININSLLLKIYRLSFKFSGKKHRDFPYFSYYNFLSKLNLEQLKILKEDFSDLTNSEIEIFEIYGFVNLEKEKELQKIEKPKKKLNQNQNVPKKEIKRNKETNHIRRAERINEKELNKIKISDFISYKGEKKYDKKFDISNIYIINDEKEFEINQKENISLNIIQTIGEELNGLINKAKDIKIKTIINLLEEINKCIIENKNIIKLVSQLKYVKLKNINSLKQGMSFWLNCFNYLILFTLFYKKWNINTQEEWKYFLKNVKYNIDGISFSFNDIQYLIFKKNLFFQKDDKINEEIKNFIVHKAEDSEIIEKKLPLLYNPFLLYLPIKGFNKPIIYDEKQFEIQINKIISDYFLNFVKINYENNIYYHELLIKFYPNFLNIDYKKFQSYIIPNIYNFIKDKKYRSIIQNNFEWKLYFDVFFND